MAANVQDVCGVGKVSRQFPSDGRSDVTPAGNGNSGVQVASPLTEMEVTTPRVGGSPADAAFRDAQQKSGADYRGARSTCRAKPRAERGACMNAARAELKHARLDAKAAHDAAKKSR